MKKWSCVTKEGDFGKNFREKISSKIIRRNDMLKLYFLDQQQDYQKKQHAEVVLPCAACILWWSDIWCQCVWCNDDVLDFQLVDAHLHLSCDITVGVAESIGTRKNLQSFRSQVASWAATQRAMYSASTVDRATMGWSLAGHEIAPPLGEKEKPW